MLLSGESYRGFYFSSGNCMLGRWHNWQNYNKLGKSNYVYVFPGGYTWTIPHSNVPFEPVFAFVFYFLDVTVRTVGRHAGGTDWGDSQYDTSYEGPMGEPGGKHSKLKYHKDIDRDRMWLPRAKTNWLAGKIQSQTVLNRLIQWKWQAG